MKYLALNLEKVKTWSPRQWESYRDKWVDVFAPCMVSHYPNEKLITIGVRIYSEASHHVHMNRDYIVRKIRDQKVLIFFSYLTKRTRYYNNGYFISTRDSNGGYYPRFCIDMTCHQLHKADELNPQDTIFGGGWLVLPPVINPLNAFIIHLCRLRSQVMSTLQEDGRVVRPFSRNCLFNGIQPFYPSAHIRYWLRSANEPRNNEPRVLALLPDFILYNISNYLSADDFFSQGVYSLILGNTPFLDISIMLGGEDNNKQVKKSVVSYIKNELSKNRFRIMVAALKSKYQQLTLVPSVIGSMLHMFPNNVDPIECAAGLISRARNNPQGASAQTLRFFKLSSDDLHWEATLYASLRLRTGL